MRSVGLENNTTSFVLTTHQANSEQYQRAADEAENFVGESSTIPTSPPGGGRPRQVNPDEISPQRPTPQESANAQPRLEEDTNYQQEKNQQPQETGKNLDILA